MAVVWKGEYGLGSVGDTESGGNNKDLYFSFLVGFFSSETSSSLRKKLQTGSIKTQMKQRGDRSLLTTQSMLCSEHLRKQSLCLQRDLGNFSMYGDRPGTQSCCFPSSSHPAKAPTRAGQGSMAGHPGKSQSDRLARSSQAGMPAAFNNYP